MDLSRRDVLQGTVAAAVVGLPLGTAEAADTGRKLKIVIAGGHPDDPESACGGLIALYADAGHDVVNLYLTRGEAGIPGKNHNEAARIRTAEAEEACSILGARPVFLSQIDGATEVTTARYDEAAAALDSEEPDIVITHWPIDTHRDHRVISLLAYDWWLRSHKRAALYYFEVEAGDQTQHFWPTHYVDITPVEDQKKKACYCHESQGAEGGFYRLHDRMHTMRGQESGTRYAEAFIRHNQSPKALPQ
jgi:LmbE family N-acetylglucosaminyl deacetylase